MTDKLKKACQIHAMFQFSICQKRSSLLSISPDGLVVQLRFHSIEKFYDIAKKQFSLLETIFNILPVDENTISQLDLETRKTIYINIQKYEENFLLQQKAVECRIPYLADRGEPNATILFMQMEIIANELKDLFKIFRLNRPNFKDLMREVAPSLQMQPKRMNAEEYTEQPAKKRLTNFGKTTLFPPTPTKNQWDDPGCAEEDLKIFSKLVKNF